MSDGEAESTTTELARTRTRLAQHRTALAAERTLFAALRTGLAIAAGGAVIIELLGAQWPAWVRVPLAAALVVIGYALIFAGVSRYRSVAKEVESTGQDQVNLLSPAFMTALIVVLEIVLAIVIVAILLGVVDVGLR